MSAAAPGQLDRSLSFFEREPALADVCVVQALRGGPRMLERREQVLADGSSLPDEGLTAAPRARRASRRR